MELGLLEEIGLTKGEIRVYTALLEIGPATTGPLAQRAGVSSSKVYKILGRLQGKGLAGYVMKDGAKRFSAQSPRRILDYIEEKRERLEERRALVERMLPELERQQGPRRAGATVYEGLKGVTNLFRNILDELEPGETYYVIGATYGEREAELRRFFYKHHQRRIDRRVRVMMLANHSLRGRLEKTTGTYSQIRFLPEYFAGNLETVFYKDRMFMVLFTREPVAVLFESREAAENLMSHFRALWRVAKP